jgi:hypothetical protein
MRTKEATVVSGLERSWEENVPLTRGKHTVHEVRAWLPEEQVPLLHEHGQHIHWTYRGSCGIRETCTSSHFCAKRLSRRLVVNGGHLFIIEDRVRKLEVRFQQVYQAANVSEPPCVIK